MNIEKIVEINSLFEQYKFLLTEKQREIVSLYYEEDYSLGEISENLNVSRQGVYDTLKRSEKILKGYEDKLNLVEKLRLQEEFTESVLKDVTYLMNNFDNKDSTNLIPKLENIEKLCREMLK